MALNFIHNLGPIKPLMLAAWRWDALNKKRRFQQVLKPNSHVLDIGSGYGMVTQTLAADGHRMLAVDVSDQSVVADAKPVVYDGHELPFMDRVLTSVCYLLSCIISQTRRMYWQKLPGYATT